MKKTKNKELDILYKNQNGEVVSLKIHPVHVTFGAFAGLLEEQWFLEAALVEGSENGPYALKKYNGYLVRKEIWKHLFMKNGTRFWLNRATGLTFFTECFLGP